MSSGHAHPDSGSFIIWANGKYLTGDSGYTGVPMTEHHNSLTFGGIGQHREGKGHDVFVGIPYERMNKIRFVDVQMSKTRVSVIADVAPAYEPEVGVKKFIRKFEFTAPNKFVITDDVETEMPKIITSFLHSDTLIKQLSGNKFVFEPNGTNLLTEVISPKMFDAKVGVNDVTGPGRPGSVDKGEREERGVKLGISTKEKVTKARFVKKLTIRSK